MNIEELLRAYALAEPRRASGGIYATAGFVFQAQVYIARFARALAAGAGVAPAGQVFVEALSDIAEVAANDSLVLLQVKRTLTAGSLDAAAAEIAAIEAFAAARGRREKIRYGIVCQYSEIDLDWTELPGRSRHQPLISSLLAEGRLAPPALHPDPRWEALSAIWTCVQDPFDFFRFAFERVLSREVDPEGAVRCRNDIAERFAKSRPDTHPPGRLVRCEDFVLDRSSRGGLEVGKQVTFARWRAGQYMARPAHAANLSNRAEALRQRFQSHPVAGLRVLWIAGRSGAGKSVALLSTIDELVKRNATVWWLKPDELAGALRLLVKQRDVPMPDFLAVDDVFDRDARDSLDLGRIGALLDEQGPRDWPVLLTCGPTEFAADFDEATRFQGFEVERVELPLLNAEEGRAFTQWVTDHGWQRGEAGQAHRQAEQGEGLFVSLAIELAYGDLKHWGEKFAQRLHAHGEDLVHSLRLCLAINRLYLRAPADWLTPQQRECLEALNRDGDFSLELASQDDEWLRLTHPHLSDAIYPHLLKADTPHTYAQDLGEAFGKALRGTERLAQRLLHAFRAQGQGPLARRMEAVDMARLAHLCVAAWKQRVAGGDIRVQAGMRVSWACWNEAHRLLGRRPEALVLDALEDMRAVETQFPGICWWPVWWNALWRAYPSHPPLVAWAAAYLGASASTGFPGWSRIWQRAFSAGVEDQRPVLVEAARQWLAAQGRQGDWHFVWKDLSVSKLLDEPECGDMLSLALRHPEAPHWPHVWQEALAAPPSGTSLGTLVSDGIRWIDEQPERDSWFYVWHALVEKHARLPINIPLAALLEIGWHWLQNHKESDRALKLWLVLMERIDDFPRSGEIDAIVEMGLDWLPGRGGHEHWPLVWQELLDWKGGSQSVFSTRELVARGFEALENAEEMDYWPFVWLSVLTRATYLPAGATVASLLERGAKWLEGREDFDQWTYVWQELLAWERQLPATVRIDPLVEAACRWLAGREEKDQWTFVWQAIFRREPLPGEFTLETLAMTGMEWVRRHESHDSAPAILKELLKASSRLSPGSQAALRSYVGDWAPRLPTWDAGPAGHLIEAVLDAGFGDDPRVLEAAKHWCGQHSGHRSWPLLLVKCLRHASTDPAWRPLADSLAGDAARHPNAGWLIKAEKLLGGLHADGVDPGLGGLLKNLRERRQAPQWDELDRAKRSRAELPATVVRATNDVVLVELESGLYALLGAARHQRYREGQRLMVRITRIQRHLDRAVASDVDESHPAPLATAGSVAKVGDQCPGAVLRHLPEKGILLGVGDRTVLVPCADLPPDAATWSKWMPKGSSWTIALTRATPQGFDAAFVKPPWTQH